MNFCKKNDEYISLLIDELLDDKTKIEFLKHMEECSECAKKLKEASYFAQLCREGQDLTLPDGFSSSLHRRLLEVSARENKSKLGFFVNNKRFIASLSTAAVLVISLLAYNLLPQIGSWQNMSDISIKNAQVEASSSADSYSGRSGETEERAEVSDKSESSFKDSNANFTASSQTESLTGAEDVQATVKFSEAVPETSKKTSEESALSSSNGAAEQGPSNQEPIKKKEIKDETALFTIKNEDPLDTAGQQYFLNYVELNMKVSPGSIEIEELKKIMNELGAIESKPVTISSIAENSHDTSAQITVKPPEFIDYYLPLSLYSTLSDQVIKHKLELNSKTEIIMNDITNIYKELNIQIIKIDKKTEEALKNGEDTTGFEAEKTKITEDMNKIITAREMITVRVFFISR